MFKPGFAARAAPALVFLLIGVLPFFASGQDCAAGYTGSYYCSGDVKQTQYQYDDCSTILVDIETCSYGCSGGECLQQQQSPAPETCTAGYTGSYQCSGNVKQTQYKYADCRTTWNDIETCTNGCSGGQCTSQTCTPSFTGSYQCSGNVKQTQYKYADCSTSWNDVETCAYGCSSGQCVQQQYYGAAPYRSNGQPSGNVLLPSQTVSLNTNEAATCRLSSASGQTYDSMLLFITTGGTYHANLIQSLQAGVNNFYVKCKNAAGSVNYDDYPITFTVTSGYGQTYAPQPYISATVTTPSGTNTGQTVYTTASFVNSGSATYINFYPYLCRSDGTDCVSMTCPSYSDSRIYISPYGSTSASCYATANTYGSNMVRMSYNYPGGDQAAYSGVFFVGTYYTPYPGYGGCTAGYTESSQCYGNVKQTQYMYSDCSTTWANIETCSYGCSGGQCLQQYPWSGSCTAGYTGSSQCYGNVKQMQYKYSDCSTAWVNSETCAYGCSAGQCLQSYSTPGGCTAGYTGSYQCSGNVKQGQYKYSDCSTAWTNIETCSYGCSGGQCTSQSVQPAITQTPQPVQYVTQSSPPVQYIIQPSPSVQYIVQPAQQTQFITQSVVSTANKCDLSISMNAKKTIEIGDSIFVDGYISDQLGNYVKIPFKFYAGGVPIADGTSNDFGYWQVGFTPSRTGSSSLKIAIPSCNLVRTGDIIVAEKPSAPAAAGATKSLDVSVYPESLDIGLGTHAILALETTTDKETTIKLTGLPNGWVQPSELTAKTGKNYIYINPDSGAQGNYELNVSAYSGGNVVFSKKINVYVSRQTPAGEKVSGSNAADGKVSGSILFGNAIAITLIGLVVAYAAPRVYGRVKYATSRSTPNEKQAYLADIKRKIEETMPFK